MKRITIAFLIVLLAIIGLHVYIMIEVPKIAQLTKKVSDLETELQDIRQDQKAQYDQNNVMHDIFHRRLSLLDKGDDTVKIVSGFVPNNYLSELNHFKNMNANDQQTYLSMSKEAKIAKYGRV